MIRHVVALATVALLTACANRMEPPRQKPLARSEVLPLALSDDFAFTKVSTFFNDPRDPRTLKPTISPMIQFEPADVTVRFEYRQENLGSHVQAQEIHYPAAQGTTLSKFTVIGDPYKEDGKVTAWRALLIVNGKVAGLHQSFLWN
jgi:hypothetical protein